MPLLFHFLDQAYYQIQCDQCSAEGPRQTEEITPEAVAAQGFRALHSNVFVCDSCQVHLGEILDRARQGGAGLQLSDDATCLMLAELFTITNPFSQVSQDVQAQNAERMVQRQREDLLERLATLGSPVTLAQLPPDELVTERLPESEHLSRYREIHAAVIAGAEISPQMLEEHRLLCRRIANDLEAEEALAAHLGEAITGRSTARPTDIPLQDLPRHLPLGASLQLPLPTARVPSPDPGFYSVSIVPAESVEPACRFRVIGRLPHPEPPPGLPSWCVPGAVVRRIDERPGRSLRVSKIEYLTSDDRVVVTFADNPDYLQGRCWSCAPGQVVEFGEFYEPVPTRSRWDHLIEED